MVYVGQTYAAGTSGFIGENPYLVFFFSGAVEGIGKHWAQEKTIKLKRDTLLKNVYRYVDAIIV